MGGGGIELLIYYLLLVGDVALCYASLSTVHNPTVSMQIIVEYTIQFNTLQFRWIGKRIFVNTPHVVDQLSI